MDHDLEAEEALDKDRAERAIIDEHRERNDWLWLTGNPSGRRILRSTLEEAGVFRTSFTGDALSSAFNEGQRNAGLKLLAKITAFAPHEFENVMKAE
jgi:hypothetical protein